MLTIIIIIITIIVQDTRKQCGPICFVEGKIREHILLAIGCAFVLSEGILDSFSLTGFIARNTGQNGGGGGLLLGNGVFKNGWSVTITCMEQ